MNGVRSVIAVSFLLQAVRTQSSLYSEVLQLGGSCEPNGTCLPYPTEDHLWGSRKCECGLQCIRHSTCCPNSLRVGSYAPMSAPRSERCQKVEGMADAIYMVAECSSTWRQMFIRDLCQRPAGDVDDPMAAVPVTSLSSSTTYKNYFCAACNFDRQRITMWNIVVDSKQKNANLSSAGLKEILVYNATERSWGYVQNDSITDESRFHKIDIKFQIPQTLLEKVKKCYPNTISSCNRWSGTDLLEKCQAYYLPVRIRVSGRKFSTFRNIHCALCNNATVSDEDEDVCRLDPATERRKRPLSFGLLFDVNRKDGEKVGEKAPCAEGQLYDPFFRKCRSMRCVCPGYVLRDGRCGEN